MSLLKRILRQPLTQFLLLGGAVFAVDAYVLGNIEDPRRIHINDARYAEIAQIFKDNRGRMPTDQEMGRLLIVWAQNEVLFREAALMELEKGDEMIRQRLILKMRNVLFNRVVPEAPTEARLRAWFEKNRSSYDRPARYDVELFQPEDVDADTAAELAQTLVDADVPTTYLASRRVYANRAAVNIAHLLSEAAQTKLVEAPDNRWVPIELDSTWFLARVTSRQAPQAAEFEQVRRRVGEEFKAQAVQQELRTALTDLAGKYDIRVELQTPPSEWDEKTIDQALLAMESVK